LFNPRRQKWSRHFVWSEDGTLIIGKTACGRATVVALQLNNPIAVLVRQQWVAVGWHPPH
jgi:geranylgeranyl pyrophosphate synthase